MEVVRRSKEEGRGLAERDGDGGMAAVTLPGSEDGECDGDATLSWFMAGDLAANAHHEEVE